MQRRSFFSRLGLALGALAGARGAAAAADIPQDTTATAEVSWSWRYRYNVALLPHDTGKTIYGVLAGPRSFIVEVFDRGVPLRQSADRLPSPGCYRVDTIEGRALIRLGAPPSGFMTADIWAAENHACSWVVFDEHLAAAATPERRALLRAEGLLFPDRERYLAHLRMRAVEGV